MPSRLFSWDSVTFINVFDGGVHRTPDEISGLREVVDMVDRRLARIVVSELVITEVLEAATQLDLLLKRPDFLKVSPSGPILMKVRALRDAARAEGRNIKVPDATHIATALLYKVEALHTFDVPMLNLNGRPWLDGLTICKPRGEQTTLGLL